jgi:hypothetical protein
MNAFESASLVAVKSWQILQPLIESRAYEGRYVVTSKGRLAKELQVSIGDLLFNSDSETIWSVELKAEQRSTGNLFLEVWSNRSQFNPGWMWKLNADLLLYHFLDSDELYSVNFQRLKRWFHGCDHRGRPPSSLYQHVEQGKYQQRNDTWGVLVPLSAIDEAIGFDLMHPEAGLTDTRHSVVERYEQVGLGI